MTDSSPRDCSIRQELFCQLVLSNWRVLILTGSLVYFTILDHADRLLDDQLNQVSQSVVDRQVAWINHVAPKDAQLRIEMLIVDAQQWIVYHDRK